MRQHGRGVRMDKRKEEGQVMEKYTRVRAAIREQGKTLTGTAHKMGVTAGTLSAMISGDPRLSTVARIADALEIPTKDLIK